MASEASVLTGKSVLRLVYEVSRGRGVREGWRGERDEQKEQTWDQRTCLGDFHILNYTKLNKLPKPFHYSATGRLDEGFDGAEVVEG